MTFALSLMGLVLFAGSAIDYSRATSLKSRLENAADAASLAAVTRSVNNNLQPPNEADVKAYFKAVAQLPSDVTLGNLTVSTSTSATSVFVTVGYQASVPTMLMNIAGIDSISVAGSAKSGADKPKYVNFYLLLDNSPSMGLGATDADIQKLQSVTPDKCAFACHQHTFNSKGEITGDSTTDYYTIAKTNGVTTRIDVLRSATQNLATSADKAQQLKNQFQMSVYTFSDTVSTISSLTSNLTTGSPNVQSLAGNIDLAYAYKDQRDTQTSFETGLKTINTKLPTPGDGSSQANAMGFVFLVTDGVQDQPVGTASGSGDVADAVAKNSTYVPPNYQVDSNQKSSLKGNVNSTRLITTLDTTLCDTIKNRGIRIAILYTPYLPITSNSFYNSWVAPIATQIPTKLQACASPGFYFQITPTQGINEAMMSMFQAALSSARLMQ